MKPGNYQSFRLGSTTLVGRELALHYELCGVDENSNKHFVETIALPESLDAPDPNDPTVSRLIDGLHRAFGVSYFKLAAPTVVDAEAVSSTDADFWTELYTEGLGEFYFTNKVNPQLFQGFPYKEESQLEKYEQPQNLSTAKATGEIAAKKALVLLGGGKDSYVAYSAMSAAGVAVDTFSLGDSHWIEKSAKSLGTSHHSARRQLDPQLPILNQEGALNGHVPISACIAFLAMLVAYANRYDYIVVGNEQSANEANIERWNGISINHQWSKSLKFERSFQSWSHRNVGHAPVYFSAVRSASELLIAKQFSTQDRHLESFASCNKNFVLSATAEPIKRWCENCPKCITVQLLLGVFLTEDQFARVFPRYFLNDESNRDNLMGILGLRGEKPFECVSATDESRVAFVIHREKGLLEPALASIADGLGTEYAAGNKHYVAALTHSGANLIPEELVSQIGHYFESS